MAYKVCMQSSRCARTRTLTLPTLTQAFGLIDYREYLSQSGVCRLPTPLTMKTARRYEYQSPVSLLCFPCYTSAQGHRVSRRGAGWKIQPPNITR